jgi:hypothetical protein
MRCGQVVEFQSDEIMEILIIHCEVKEKVRHDCLPTLFLTLAVSTRRSTSPQHHLELTCTRTIVDVQNFGTLHFLQFPTRASASTAISLLADTEHVTPRANATSSAPVCNQNKN